MKFTLTALGAVLDMSQFNVIVRKPVSYVGQQYVSLITSRSFLMSCHVAWDATFCLRHREPSLIL